MGKHKKAIKVLIILVGVCLFILLFPMPYSMTDGGSIGVMSPFGIYDIKRCHEAYGGGTEIDGVHYKHSESPIRYKVGIQVTVFGADVIDITHFEPDVVEPLEYEDEVRDLISYYNSHQVEDIELGSVYISEWKIENYVTLYFSEVSEIEKSDQIVKVIKAYLNENPDSFLYNDFIVNVDAIHQELVEKTSTSEAWLMYEAYYVIDPTDKSILELRLSTSMIPEEVPPYYSFEDVKTIKLTYSDSLTENQKKTLSTIYPNAELVS